MSEKSIKAELNRVGLLIKSDLINTDIWIAYKKGIQRQYFKAQLVSDEEHNTLSALQLSKDPKEIKIGTAYFTGLNYKIGTKLGRNYLFDEPTKVVSVRIPESIIIKMKKKHKNWLRDLAIEHIDDD